MMKLLAVCIGGAIGSGGRYLISTWSLARLGTAFPYGTLVVNTLGSFLICAIMQIAIATTLISPSMRLFLTTGIMGGLTTYSTFDYETLRLTEQGDFALALLNVALTLGVCFVAGMAGQGVARILFRG